MLRDKVQRLTVVLGTVAATAICAPPAWASEGPCLLEVMEQPSSGHALLLAGDSSGRYQAGVWNDGDHSQFSLAWWQDGTPHVALSMHSSVTVTGVNRSGTIVGHQIFGADWSAWRYQPGTTYLTGLPAPDYRVASTNANAINDEGWVVGGWTNSDTGQELPLMWSPDSAVSSLPLPEGYQNAVATGIDAAGTPVGHAYNTTDDGMPTQQRAVAWLGPDRRPEVLPVSDPVQGSYQEQIAGGVVVARNGANHVLRWDGLASEPVVLAGNVGWLEALNASGSVLLAENEANHASLLRDGQLRALEPGGVPLALTDDDVVYGYAGWGAAIRWDCGG